MDGPAGVKKVAGTGTEQTRFHSGKQGVDSGCDAECDAISADWVELLSRAVMLVAGMKLAEAERAARRWPAKGGKAKSLGHRLPIDRHALLEVPVSRPFPLIRVLLEVGIFFIYDKEYGRRATFSPTSPQCQSCRFAAG